MLLLARKNLFSERTRLAISVGGIALAVLLITFLLALFRGWSEKVGGFVEGVDADVWVASEGATNFLTAASILPIEEAEEGFAGIGSIDDWNPLIVRPITATKGDTEMDVQFVGFDPVTGSGGPIKIEDGAAVPGLGEVIVDVGVSKRYGVGIGDTIEAGGDEFLVVGKSSGGDFVARQTIFVTHTQAQQTLRMEGFTTFFLLRVNSPNALLFVDAQDGVTAFTNDEFAAETRDLVLSNVIPILTVVLILAFIVGLSVAGLTIYTATVEKTREYGILKAVGFSNRYLYRLVVEQSMLIALFGFIIGAGITIITGPFIDDLVPQFVTFIRWQDVLAVAGLTVLMAGLAAYVPVRRLAAIDPVTVFSA
jgi:putative ABC transport system permease protein